MKIRAFMSSSGSSHWRVTSPANFINSQEGWEYLCFPAKAWQGDVLDGDIVLLQMVVNPEIIQQIHAQGAKVVYELDDLLTKRTYREEVDNPGMFIKNTEKMLKQADLVTTTTRPLADELSKYTDQIEIIPNFIDLDWWGEPLRIKRRGNLRLGWAGSTSHQSDLRFIKEPIAKILEEFEDVTFIYCGAGGASSASRSTELLFGKDVFSNIPPERKEYHLGINHELWGAKSKTLHFDIALAPLIDDAFNKSKSNIKWQEYALNEWAGIYTDLEPYDNIKGGLKAVTQDDWYNQIKYLITHPEKRQEIVSEARSEVLANWTMNNNYTLWMDAFEKCLNQ